MSDPDQLYESMKSALKRGLRDLEPDRHPGILTFPARAFDEATETLFSNLRSSGYCTIVVASPESWNPNAPYYERVRQAARQGRTIERVFLLSHRHARNNPSLAEHVRLDAEAGIRATVLNIGELLAEDRLSHTDRLEVGLWDEHLTCVSLRGRGASGQEFTEWSVSRRPEDADYVRELRSQLLEAEEIDLDAPDNALHLEEPLVTSAPLAMRLAPVLCAGNHVDREDCSWYHGSWQFLRVFDMVSTPTWHVDFYLENIRAATEQGARRVLITGTADYSMYAHVLHAARAAGVEPDVTVLDLCETPLMLCRWYGQLAGHQPIVIRSDVLDFESPEPYDLVVTDAFITRFVEADRARVAKAWARYLRAGGRLITTARIEPGHRVGTSIVPTRDQIEGFRRGAHKAAERWKSFLLTDPADIDRAAETYASRMVSNALASAEELRLVLEPYFEIEWRFADVPGELKPTTYAEVVATKRS
jgi:hypothetical protein